MHALRAFPRSSVGIVAIARTACSASRIWATACWRVGRWIARPRPAPRAFFDANYRFLIMFRQKALIFHDFEKLTSVQKSGSGRRPAGEWGDGLRDHAPQPAQFGQDWRRKKLHGLFSSTRRLWTVELRTLLRALSKRPLGGP